MPVLIRHRAAMSAAQYDAWFDANVTPNIPFEITQEVVDLHSVHTP
jgi:hypothetical protein